MALTRVAGLSKVKIRKNMIPDSFFVSPSLFKSRVFRGALSEKVQIIVCERVNYTLRDDSSFERKFRRSNVSFWSPLQALRRPYFFTLNVFPRFSVLTLFLLLLFLL